MSFRFLFRELPFSRPILCGPILTLISQSALSPKSALLQRGPLITPKSRSILHPVTPHRGLQSPKNIRMTLPLSMEMFLLPPQAIKDEGIRQKRQQKARAVQTTEFRVVRHTVPRIQQICGDTRMRVLCFLHMFLKNLGICPHPILIRRILMVW